MHWHTELSRTKLTRTTIARKGSPEATFKQTEACNYDVDLLVMINSAIYNFDLRESLRFTWLHHLKMRKLVVRHVFVVAETEDHEVQWKLNLESRTHGDIIQGDFIDNYYNNTLKMKLILHWSASFCSKIHFLLKADDDIIVNPFHMYSVLKLYAGKQDLLVGRIRRNIRPTRDPVHKWYISSDDYPNATYPDYPLGFGYLISGDLVLKLNKATINTPVIPIDDVYVGM
ncbi:UDP-GlcNAc:betaGal beta-1,3-N-acetylglucosaminyltransferase 7-like [Saccoglossus kowalevskii]